MLSVVVTGTVHVPASVFTYLFSSVLFMFNSHLNRDCDPATVEIKMKVWQQVPSRKSRVHGWYETFARCPLVLKVRVWLWLCSDGSNACCSWMWKANVDAVFSDASEFIHRSLEICGPFLQSSSLFWLVSSAFSRGGACCADFTSAALCVDLLCCTLKFRYGSQSCCATDWLCTAR